MFSALYFPLIGLASKNMQSISIGCISKSILDGQLIAANRAIASLIDSEKFSHSPYALQLYADLLMSMGQDVDAEEAYSRVRTLLHASKFDLHVASCRNAGWMALFRHRLTTAVACFLRLRNQNKADPILEIEATFGAACALHSLGKIGEADDMLSQIGSNLDALGNKGCLWKALMDALRFDFLVQNELYSVPEFNDHIYWRSSIESMMPRAQFNVDLPSVASTLLGSRMAYLENLRIAIHGERCAMNNLIAHLKWASSEGLAGYQQALRLEISAAAIAGGMLDIADAMLQPLQLVISREYAGHRSLECLYLAAKTAWARGNSEKGWLLYKRYALCAMKYVRETSPPMILPMRSKRPLSFADDIDTRLPARYRLAYRFMLDNIARHDLSVCEIAAEIGVTERALQWAFRKSLGVSPTELIRSLRMHGIRDELLNSRAPDILEIARKWGVTNRSSLINGYRREFNETPSETSAI